MRKSVKKVLPPLRYKEEEYLNTGIYGEDEDIQLVQVKLVVCRTKHTCPECGRIIQPQERALSERGFERGGGPVSCYTCIPCMEKWMDTLDMKCNTCHYSGSQCEDTECFDSMSKPHYRDKDLGDSD
jgi:hypothetical protein